MSSSRAKCSSRLKPLALAAPAACALLAACGGSGAPATSSATAKQQSEEQKAETKFQDFARCLREHGLNAEAISHPGGGHGVKMSPGSGGPQQAEAAEKACARYRPEAQDVDVSPQQKVEQEETIQKFAKCMREHGIEVEAGPGGVRVTLHGTPGGSGPSPPGFKRAQSACQKPLLPDGGPGR